MARGGKRPNPGPKPRPEDRRVQILVRVRPEIRKKLEGLAKNKKWSLSRVVERLLDRRLIDVDWRGDHHYWFGLLMARIAWDVEQRMRLNPPFFAKSKGWLKHPFAAQYVRATAIAMLNELMPDGPLGPIPDDMRRTAKQLPPSFSPEQVDYFNSPDGLGRELARELIHGLRYDTSPFANAEDVSEDYNEMPCVQDADLMPKIAKGLGLEKRRDIK